MTQRTHWRNCFMQPGHHECAIARVGELCHAVVDRDADAALRNECRELIAELRQRQERKRPGST